MYMYITYTSIHSMCICVCIYIYIYIYIDKAPKETSRALECLGGFDGKTDLRASEFDFL